MKTTVTTLLASLLGIVVSAQTISVNDDLSWINGSATYSSQSPDFPFCDEDVNYIISTTNGDFKRVSPSQGNGLVTPANTSSNDNGQIDINFSFNQPVENLRIYVVDLDYNTANNSSNAPEEYLTDFTSDNSSVTPLVTSVVGNVYWDNATQGVVPTIDNSSGWIEFSGIVQDLEFTYNRPGTGWGLIIDSVQFNCTKSVCACPATVNYTQIGQVSKEGVGFGNLHVNSGSDAISSLTIELPFYEIETVPECRECDVDNVASHGTISAVADIDGVSGVFYNPANNQAAGFRKVTFNFPAPVVLNEQIKLDLLFPPVLDLACCMNRVNYCFSVTLRKEDCTSCEYLTCSTPGLEGISTGSSADFHGGHIEYVPDYEAKTKGMFVVSPNPTSDVIKAEIIENDFSKGKVSLRNSIGQLISSYDTRSRRIEIPVNTPGVYLLTLESNGEKSTKQVVVR